jgi:hypothetical protein
VSVGVRGWVAVDVLEFWAEGVFVGSDVFFRAVNVGKSAVMRVFEQEVGGCLRGGGYFD